MDIPKNAQKDTLKSVCFDIFGVLVLRHEREFIQTHVPAVKHSAVDALNRRHELGQLDTVDYYQSIADLTTPPIDPDVCRSRMIGERVLNMALMETIADIKPKDGNGMYGLFSNTGGDYIDYFAPSHLTLFEQAIISADIGTTKPELPMFMEIYKRLQLAPENILMIDDSKQNCTIAEKLGMDVLHYTHSPQSVQQTKQVIESFFSKG